VGLAVDRGRLQRLASTRLDDAKALLETERWSGAYYLCGYAIECGLKACLLRHLGESDAVFGDFAYVKKLADCWTHDLVKLVNLAGLDAAFGDARGANQKLAAHWGVTKDWRETSRYEEKDEREATALYKAVSDNTDGVLQWIQKRW